MESLEEITLYRFRVRAADGREQLSTIVATRRRMPRPDEKAPVVEEVLRAEDENKPEPMLANLRWSDDSFDHGDHATMMVDAPGLDGRTLRFAVEHRHKGDWAPYDKVEAKVENGVAEARLQLHHPAPGEADTSAADLRFCCELVETEGSP
jgi:hypothetical protein